MRSISFRSILIAAAVGFFALGIFSVLLKPPAASPDGRTFPGTTPVSTAPSMETPQVNILVLGVDTLSEKKGQLLAVWLASFRPSGRELFLFGFATDRTLDDGRTAREAYAGEEGAQALGDLTSLPLDAIVVLDAEGFAALIDAVGGMPTGESTVPGQAAVGVLALLQDDPQAALLAQARLLEAMRSQAGAVQPGTDLQPMLDVAEEHASVSIPAEQLLAKVAPYLPFESERIHVSLPWAGGTGDDD